MSTFWISEMNSQSMIRRAAAIFPTALLPVGKWTAKSNDPEKTTDGISQRRNEANLILGLAILGISCIGMMIALLNKRRKYREKLFR